MEHVEVARAESERGELVLRERRVAGAPAILELRANGIFVMDTWETSSERALATAALELADQAAEVLVGGLGLGFTMHEVLADHRVERCTVVEIEPALVDWMRDGTIPHGPGMLADERIRLVVNDIARALVEAGDASYDLVLLDVDNGPDYLVHETNAVIYEPPLLSAARRAVRPGGTLVIWSAARSEELEETLRTVFGNAEARGYDVQLQDREETYWLYVARA